MRRGVASACRTKRPAPAIESIARACRALGGPTPPASTRGRAGGFERLGARADLARAGRLAAARVTNRTRSRPRQYDVLRVVATGKSNREVAESLGISEHTVARHLQNIFTRLGLSLRPRPRTPTSTVWSDRTRGDERVVHVVNTDPKRRTVDVGNFGRCGGGVAGFVRSDHAEPTARRGKRNGATTVADCSPPSPTAPRRSRPSQPRSTDLLDDYRAARYFRILVPTSHGGTGADLVTALRTYEDLAAS